MGDSSLPVLHSRDDGDGHSVGNEGGRSHSEMVREMCTKGEQKSRAVEGRGVVKGEQRGEGGERGGRLCA